MLKLASVPLNRTALAWVKSAPLMVMLVPTAPLVGEKPVIAGGTAFTAAPASSMPLPHFEVLQVLPLGKALAVFCRIWSTWEGVR
jgi:hypothetical protein